MSARPNMRLKLSAPVSRNPVDIRKAGVVEFRL